MSTEAIGHAFGQRLPGTEKWVLVCLARFADEWGYSVFPALDELADKTGFSEATCKRTLKELVKLGRLRRIAQATPVSPAFWQIVGVPEPEKPKAGEPHCSAALRRAVLYEFGARCEYCGKTGTKDVGPDGKTWQIDRVVANMRGGTYCPDNVTLSCKTCNNKKKTKPAPAGTRTLSTMQLARVRGVQSAPSPPAVSLIPGGGHPAPREGSTRTPGGVSLTPDLSDLLPILEDSSKAGAPPRHREKDENPDENIRVITVIAHEVIDQLGLDHPDLSESVKSLCAVRTIAYNTAVVWKALDSARWQRTHRSREAS